MGAIFAVVGFTTGNFGLMGFGVVVALVGYFSKPKSDQDRPPIGADMCGSVAAGSSVRDEASARD